MWRKGEKLRVDGAKVYVDHVFEDGSASIRDMRTGLLKGKIPAKINPEPKTINKPEPLNITTSTPQIYEAGLSVQNYNRLLEAQEAYEIKTEAYYNILEEGEGDLNKAEKEMRESLTYLKKVEKEIFA
jgi:hypothetical protein